MQVFKFLINLIFTFSLGSVIYLFISLFLNKLPVEYIKSTITTKSYYIDLSSKFFTNSKTNNILPIKKLNFKLKAIYNNKNQGFIIIEDNLKTHFINLNETYKGYKLIKIGLKYAIFKKNNKMYKISFKNIDVKNSTSYLSKVSKSTLIEYKNNPTKIWNNIGIIQDKKGYKITYIKPGSIFEKLGLKRGDVIIEVNGKRLLNDEDAWYLYKNALNFTNVNILILRNNQQKVLHYEIY